ncbi:MAG: outer membrane protein assembly factor BamE [Alphaproteobacteria bacterium]|nr:outer membrane protein assembly factor BamE [Alphaproteobacteria bacterium]
MKNATAKIAVIMALALAACSPTVVTRGNLISETKFQQVQPKVSTRADVMQYWGPPTTTSSFDPNTWYYIGETTSQKGIYAPEVEKRRMIRVKFDPANNDTVVEVADLDPAEARDIQLVGRQTPAAGKDYTVIQQLIGNLGKYNTDTAK